MSKAFFFGVLILASISSHSDDAFFPANTTVVLNHSLTTVVDDKGYYQLTGLTKPAGTDQQKIYPLSDDQYCIPMVDIKGEAYVSSTRTPRADLTFAGKDVGDAPTTPRKLLSSKIFESYDWYSLTSPEAKKCRALNLEVNKYHIDHTAGSSPEFPSKEQNYLATCINGKSHNIRLAISSPSDPNKDLILQCHVNSSNRGDIKKALDPLITLNYKMSKEDQPSASPVSVKPTQTTPTRNQQ